MCTVTSQKTCRLANLLSLKIWQAVNLLVAASYRLLFSSSVRSLQTGQSWMDKARHGVLTSLTYTQQGLEWTKTKVAGQTGQAPPQHGASAGQHMPSTSSGQYTAPAYVPSNAADTANNAATGANMGHPAAPSGVNPAYGRVYNPSGASGVGNTCHAGTGTQPTTGQAGSVDPSVKH